MLKWTVASMAVVIGRAMARRGRACLVDGYGERRGLERIRGGTMRVRK